MMHPWEYGFAGAIVGAILQRLWDLRTITALKNALLEVKRIDNIATGQVKNERSSPRSN